MYSLSNTALGLELNFLKVILCNRKKINLSCANSQCFFILTTYKTSKTGNRNNIHSTINTLNEI